MSRPSAPSGGTSLPTQLRLPPAGLLAVVLLLTGCVRPSVPACPLDEGRIVDRVKHRRSAPSEGGALGLDAAVALLRENNPEVRQARADAWTAQALANVRTPLPNPTLEIAPLLYGADLLESAAWGVDAALGFTVLLADTRTLTDDVNRVRAAAAWAEAGAVEREQYLALRGEYVAVRTLGDLRDAQQDLAEAVERTTASAEKAVEAGAATALDVQLLKLEAAQVRAELYEGEEAWAAARGDLGARLGVAVVDTTLEPAELPPIPAQIPDTATLERLVVDHHPRLVALRAAYLVAEKELRLEAARAWPELGVGLGYEKEEDHKVGLPLGIEIPLFDRNQPGIAEALANRDALRARFEAEVHRILADVERARARLAVRHRRYELLEAQLDPAERTQQTAEAVLQQTGTFDMLRYLEVLRSTRRVRVEHLASRADVFAGWSALEQACGAPLLRFDTGPGAPPAGAVPARPAPLGDPR